VAQAERRSRRACRRCGTATDRHRFSKFVDGRGYSSARLLRDKHRFGGELRAIGDVLRDQLYYLRQCGFDAFAVRTDRNFADAIGGLDDFSDNYQSTSAQPVPLFRRRSKDATAADDWAPPT
jgi:uncharacterized protein (DUF934 family)